MTPARERVDDGPVSERGWAVLMRGEMVLAGTTAQGRGEPEAGKVALAEPVPWLPLPGKKTARIIWKTMICRMTWRRTWAVLGGRRGGGWGGGRGEGWGGWGCMCELISTSTHSTSCCCCCCLRRRAVLPYLEAAARYLLGLPAQLAVAPHPRPWSRISANTSAKERVFCAAVRPLTLLCRTVELCTAMCSPISCTRHC